MPFVVWHNLGGNILQAKSAQVRRMALGEGYRRKNRAQQNCAPRDAVSAACKEKPDSAVGSPGWRSTNATGARCRTSRASAKRASPTPFLRLWRSSLEHGQPLDLTPVEDAAEAVADREEEFAYRGQPCQSARGSVARSRWRESMLSFS
jgi:hypothetical protein